ncbi:hypothetical protein C5S32_00085 [ANME-1 cluster archaeon GoMg1]|nr:hypothetical protein [ANME-1 cluster archaeon GoMg1]
MKEGWIIGIGMRTFRFKFKSVLVIVTMGCLLLSFLLLPQAALAQEGLWNHSSPTWAITYIHSGGSWNVSQDHSHYSYTEKNLSKTFTHFLYANASGGESVILDTWSVTPSSYGSQLSTGTAIGYDSLGTEGQLTTREGTVVGIYSRDIGCLDASVGSQVTLTQGIAHSSTRAEKGIDYDFSAQGKGSVEVGCNAVPISSNSHGTYSQHITADGEFNIYYSADISLRGNPSCPFGGAP